MRGVYGCKEFLGFEESLKFEEFLGFEESLESNDRGGGGLTRIMPLPHWPIGCNESSKMRHIFGLFSTQFSPSHTLWDGRKEVKYSGKQPQSQCSYIL